MDVSVGDFIVGRGTMTNNGCLLHISDEVRRDAFAGMAASGRGVTTVNIVFEKEQRPLSPGSMTPDQLVEKLKTMGLGDEIARARKRIAEHLLPSSKVSLRALRLQAGLSQAELAEMIGTKQSSVSRLENDPVGDNPSLARLKAIYKALRLSDWDHFMSAFDV